MEKSSVEEFRDIPGLEGRYQVSNLGRIKRLAYEVDRGASGVRRYEEKIWRGTPYRVGVKSIRTYYAIQLYGHLRETMGTSALLVHVAVMMAFKGYTDYKRNEIVVHHINDNPEDNRLENLEITTNRRNVGLSEAWQNGSSKHTGVSLHSSGRWQATIRADVSHKSKILYLGLYNCEETAAGAYRKALKLLNYGCTPLFVKTALQRYSKSVINITICNNLL